jgi:hypothetical protein
MRERRAVQLAQREDALGHAGTLQRSRREADYRDAQYERPHTPSMRATRASLSHPVYARGGMLWRKRKTFCGSYLRLTATSRL